MSEYWRGFQDGAITLIADAINKTEPSATLFGESLMITIEGVDPQHLPILEQMAGEARERLAKEV